MTIDAEAADSAALRYTKLTGTAGETVRADVERRAREAKDAGERPTYTELLIAALDAVADVMSDLDGVEDGVDRRPMHERSTPKETPGQLAPERKGPRCGRCGKPPVVHPWRMGDDGCDGTGPW